MSKLVITTGTVDIEVDKDSVWAIDTNITGEAQGSNNNFTHLKTGDVLKRTITIKNKGNLASKITNVSVEGAPTNVEGINYSDDALINLAGTVLAANDNKAGGDDEVSVDLTLTITGNHAHKNTTSTKEGVLNKDGGYGISFEDTKYIINAEQNNPRTSSTDEN